MEPIYAYQVVLNAAMASMIQSSYDVKYTDFMEQLFDYIQVILKSFVSMSSQTEWLGGFTFQKDMFRYLFLVVWTLHRIDTEITVEVWTKWGTSVVSKYTQVQELLQDAVRSWDPQQLHNWIANELKELSWLKC